MLFVTKDLQVSTKVKEFKIFKKIYVIFV